MRFTTVFATLTTLAGIAAAAKPNAFNIPKDGIQIHPGKETKLSWTPDDHKDKVTIKISTEEKPIVGE